MNDEPCNNVILGLIADGSVRSQTLASFFVFFFFTCQKVDEKRRTATCSIMFYSHLYSSSYLHVEQITESN